MNNDIKHADSVKELLPNKPLGKGKPRRFAKKVHIKSGRVIAGKFDPNQLNQRLEASMVATPRRNMQSCSCIQSQLDKRHINPSDLKSIKSGSVVISIMDGILRVMDGSNCMYEQQVSYKALSYARSVKASSMVIVSNDVQPFGFVSSVFDDTGPVCFWRTMKCNDTVVLIFWGKHE